MPAAELTAEYLYSLQQTFSEVFDVELVAEHSAAELEAAFKSGQVVS